MVSETSPRCRPDILERAKAADIDSLAGTDWGALREIVQGLIAEVERLRSQSVEQVFRRKNEEIAAKDARIEELEALNESLLENDNDLRTRCQKAETRIKELEATLVDVRAEYLLLLDTNQDTVAWQLDEISEQDQDKFRRQARESLKMEEPLVMIQLREARGQIERLEAAFLRSNAAMRYYQEGNRGPWPQLGEKFKEPYQEKAREALKRIKEGGKDE